MLTFLNLSCVGVGIEENGHEGGLKGEGCFLSIIFPITSLLLIIMFSIINIEKWVILLYCFISLI